MSTELSFCEKKNIFSNLKVYRKSYRYILKYSDAHFCLDAFSSCISEISEDRKITDIDHDDQFNMMHRLSKTKILIF